MIRNASQYSKGFQSPTPLILWGKYSQTVALMVLLLLLLMLLIMIINMLHA